MTTHTYFAIADTKIRTSRSVEMDCGCCSDVEYFWTDVAEGQTITWDWENDEITIDGVVVEYEGNYPHIYDVDVVEQ